MFFSGLSLRQSLPLFSVVRFLLNAPLFLAFFAVALAWEGSSLFVSRWSRETIATIHLVTLGAISGVMFGAIPQLLAVVAGVTVPGIRAFLLTVYTFFMTGILLFAAGFYASSDPLLATGAFLLVGSIFLFATVFLWRLRTATLFLARTIRYGLLSLLMTALLGSVFVYGHVTGEFLLDRSLFQSLHIAWGVAGWIFILISGVSFQVLPMFYVARDVPESVKRLPDFVFAALVFSTLSTFFSGLRFLLPFGYGAIAILILFYSLYTARVLIHRKKKLPDSTLLFWYSGLISLAASILLFVAASFTDYVPVPELAVLIYLYGFVVSILHAMLYKIVPFLVWLHLFSAGKSDVPNTRQLLPNRRMTFQFAIHVAGTLSLCVTPFFPDQFARIGGGLLLCASLLLFRNLSFPLATYIRLGRESVASPIVAEAGTDLPKR